MVFIRHRRLCMLIYLSLGVTMILVTLLQLPNQNETHSTPKAHTFPEKPTQIVESTVPEEQKPWKWLEKARETNIYPPQSKRPKYRNQTKLDIFRQQMTEEPDNYDQYLAFINNEKQNKIIQNFFNGITNNFLYPRNSQWISCAENIISTSRIRHAENKPGGSQLKAYVNFDDNFSGLLKPMRMTREQETFPDHFYFSDIERHNSEIASYHLDRLLDFRRAPPVVGRWVNLTELRNVSDSRLKKTFFISPANNTCFHGTCDYYCRTETAVCGHPTMIEASIALFLPSSTTFPRSVSSHPFKRTYTRNQPAEWENNDQYCKQKVLTDPLYSIKDRRIYDIVDMAIFDFLIDNKDRHHYETFEEFRDSGFILHLDQGRGFGHQKKDDLSILAPLTQCCKLRWTTWHTLTRIGEFGLGDLLHDALVEDPLAPVLATGHYSAVDRRMKIIMARIEECIEKINPENVFDTLINDET